MSGNIGPASVASGIRSHPHLHHHHGRGRRSRGHDEAAIDPTHMPRDDGRGHLHEVPHLDRDGFEIAPAAFDIDVSDLSKLDISFAGCGFLGIYHVGVAAAFATFRPDISFRRMCGASAGAIVATALAGGVPIPTMINAFLESCCEAAQMPFQALNPFFNVTAKLREKLDELLPHDIHFKVNGKLNISVTNVYHKTNMMVNFFDNRNELIESILSSAFIPLFSGFAPIRLNGCLVIDGGFTSNLPRLSRNTITVSPFAGCATISPMDNSKHRDYDIFRFKYADHSLDLTAPNMHRLSNVVVVPGPTRLSQLLQEGFQDGFRFLRNKGLVSCSQCMTVTTLLKPARHDGDEDVDDDGEDGGAARCCNDTVECDNKLKTDAVLPSSYRSQFDSFVGSVSGEFRRQQDEHQVVARVLSCVWWVTKFSPPVLACRCAARLGWATASACLWAIQYVYDTFLKEICPLMEFIRSEQAVRKFEETFFLRLKDLYVALQPYLGTNFEWVNLQRVPAAHKRARRRRPPTLGPSRHVEVSVTKYATVQEAEAEEQEKVPAVSTPEIEISGEDDVVATSTATPGEEGDMDGDDGLPLGGEDSLEVMNFSFDGVADDISYHQASTGLEEPGQLQLDNLYAASRSTVTSRVNSRMGSLVGSRTGSVIGSRHSSRHSSRRGSFSNLIETAAATNDEDLPDGAVGGVGSEDGDDVADRPNETLTNILHIAESQDPAMAYYYKNEDGDIVTYSLYNVTDTDPVEIIGDDFDYRPPDADEVNDQLLSVGAGIHPERFVPAAVDDPEEDEEQQMGEGSKE